MKNDNVNQWFSVRVAAVILGVAALVTGSTVTTMVFAVSQTLPTCTDPTGQNLPCMMVISTLPPPANAAQCQESSGQILPCSYAIQNLSNGQEVMVITVYTPANYVFGGYGPWTVVKLIVHETKTRIVHECPDDQILNHTSHKCVEPILCDRADSNAVTDLDKNLKTTDCDIHDANEHGMTATPPGSTCKDNTTCPSSATLPAPNNTSIPSSGGSGTGSTCVNNCTSGTPAPVYCTKNPTDPSCSQSLTPSATTPPSTSVPPPTTKTCPDGSVIDASATCPTPPTTSGTPPTPSNNPSSPSGNNPPSGGTGSGGSGSSGSSGSSSPSPNTP